MRASCRQSIVAIKMFVFDFVLFRFSRWDKKCACLIAIDQTELNNNKVESCIRFGEAHFMEILASAFGAVKWISVCSCVCWCWCPDENQTSVIPWQQLTYQNHLLLIRRDTQNITFSENFLVNGLWTTAREDTGEGDPWVSVLRNVLDGVWLLKDSILFEGLAAAIFEDRKSTLTTGQQSHPVLNPTNPRWKISMPQKRVHHQDDRGMKWLTLLLVFISLRIFEFIKFIWAPVGTHSTQTLHNFREFESLFTARPFAGLEHYQFRNWVTCVCMCVCGWRSTQALGDGFAWFWRWTNCHSHKALSEISSQLSRQLLWTSLSFNFVKLDTARGIESSLTQVATQRCMESCDARKIRTNQSDCNQALPHWCSDAKEKNGGKRNWLLSFRYIR